MITSRVSRRTRHVVQAPAKHGDSTGHEHCRFDVPDVSDAGEVGPQQLERQEGNQKQRWERIPDEADRSEVRIPAEQGVVGIPDTRQSIPVYDVGKESEAYADCEICDEGEKEDDAVFRHAGSTQFRRSETPGAPLPVGVWSRFHACGATVGTGRDGIVDLVTYECGDSAVSGVLVGHRDGAVAEACAPGAAERTVRS